MSSIGTDVTNYLQGGGLSFSRPVSSRKVLTLENILVSTSSPHSDGGGDKSIMDERLSESILRRFFMCINDMFYVCKYLKRSPLSDCRGRNSEAVARTHDSREMTKLHHGVNT